MAKKLKVALVHDYLPFYGGAELVLSELHKMFPKAPIYVALVSKRGMGPFWKLFEKADIRTSWFQYLPFPAKLISPLRFLLPTIWNSFDFSDYDLVISSASWAITRGFKKKGENTVEICYMHTPPRYLYGYDTSRSWENRWYGWFVRVYAGFVNHFMRMYDFDTAQRVDHFVANSKNVAARIQKFYRCESTVIYPPVEVNRILDSKIKPEKGEYYLAGGRLVASKNFDLIIKSCKELGVELKIFGMGVEEKRLKKLSDDSIEFLGRVSESRQVALFRGARAFIIAEKDSDFGITPIEAAAAGCPSIAYKSGGYLETIANGKTGIFFDKLTTKSLVGAISRFEKTNIKPGDCRAQAKKFSVGRFKKEMIEFVNTNAGAS